MDDFARELEKDFLEEAFSLLDGLEKSLLALEKNSSDSKAINEVFRAAHTIKGGAGTVGFDEIQEFTHTIEDILDMVRKSKLDLQSSDISALLECRDELEKMLNAREQAQVYKSERTQILLNRLTQIKARGNAAAAAKVAEAPKTEPVAPVKTVTNQIKTSEGDLILTNTDISMMSDALSSGKFVYIMKYELEENYEMKEVSAFQLYSLIRDTGEIIKLQPSLEELENNFFPKVEFVIACDKSEAFLREKTNMADMVKAIEIVKVDANVLDQLEDTSSGQGNGRMEESVKAVAPEASKTPEVQKPEAVAEKPAEAKAPEKTSEGSEEDSSVEKRNLSTLRVESWKVDNLLNLLGELVITKATFSQLDLDFDRLINDVRFTMKEFISGISRLNLSGESDIVAKKNEMLLAAIQSLFVSVDTFSENIQKLNRISSSLQENVMNMRMVPIQMVFSRFPRLIRDIANKLNKKIDLIIEGVETEIDKGMVDDVFDPLIHLLRNAVDHGIEPPDERKALAKPEIGKIVLKAVHEGDSIVIEVRDDGHGIDAEKIRDKALEGGFFSKEALAKMSQREILSIIFLPGFSTAKEVSNMSGRGVGMDVVKKKIEEIGGSVGIATVKGKGTKIIIRLPLTLAIIQGLLIVVEGVNYVIPVAAVEETVIITPSDIREINGNYAFELREKLIPVLFLRKFFYGIQHQTTSATKEYCIVTKYGDKQVGIIVNEVIGEQDIVIKPLNTKLIKSPGISAATVVGNGDIGYIIDTSQVITYYFKSMNKEAETE